MGLGEWASCCDALRDVLQSCGQSADKQLLVSNAFVIDRPATDVFHRLLGTW
jgi:hypothetical protein